MFQPDGRLELRRSFVNPTPRHDPQRVNLSDVARETKLLLPGLLATRPDVTNESYLCSKIVLDTAYCPHLPPTRIRVLAKDTIDAALLLLSSEPKPVAVLNMANARTPGGGWLHGALAQEEALCYRSSLSATLHDKHYPIPERSAIYSPTVMVIRSNVRGGNQLLDFRDPSKLSVISVLSCAAVCQPQLRQDSQGNNLYQNPKDEGLMLDKMRIVLRAAIRNGHRQIVLGAFGCGVFGNPSREVVLMWKQVLREQEFQGGWWRDVIFAVLPGGRVDNYATFQAELDGERI